MIYTCYEMIRDCREGKPEGWLHFVKQYVPVIRRIAARRAPAGSAEGKKLDDLVRSLSRPAPGIFQELAPVQERVFVADLRNKVLAMLVPDRQANGADPSAVLGALEPFSLLERQAIWLATLGYDATTCARMLKSDVPMVERVRQKAAERAGSDFAEQWARVEPGRPGQDCLPVKVFLDTIDGRNTWPVRSSSELHINRCLFCLDHFCRMHETMDLLRAIEPLNEAETAHFGDVLGIAAARPTGWKRLFGGAR